MPFLRLTADFFDDWLHPGLRCSRLEPAADSDNGEQVVLVHGLFHRAWAQRELGRFLARHGYRVYLYDYRSTRDDLAGHAIRFRRWLEALPESRRTHFVTHSLGGLLMRKLLAAGPFPVLAGAWIMLGTPNHGSPVAAWGMRWVPFAGALIRTLPELSDAPGAPVHRLFVPVGIPFAVIAADRDRLVPAASTHLTGEVRFRTVHSGHSFLMNAPETRKLLLKWMKKSIFWGTPLDESHS